jgi:uncharacterized protein YegP (UPF0339 family)
MKKKKPFAKKISKPRAAKSSLTIYVNTKTGQWYWNIWARNGKIVADGAEAYMTQAKARQGFKAAAKLAAKALAKLSK